MHTRLTAEDEMTSKEILSTITSKGQVTIPAEVRKHLDLKAGDKVVFVLEDEGEVRLAVPQYPDIESLRGAAGSLKTPLSWEETLQIARQDHLASKTSSQS
jgi:antitoxin PrlF